MQSFLSRIRHYMRTESIYRRFEYFNHKYRSVLYRDRLIEFFYVEILIYFPGDIIYADQCLALSPTYK